MKSVGLTFHEATESIDSGNIYKQFNIPITNFDTIVDVYDKINTKILKTLSSIVHAVFEGDIGKAQRGVSTFCCTRIPSDGYIDWDQTSRQIYNLIRALSKPFPGAYTYLNSEKLTIWDSEIPKKQKLYEGKIPGRVSSIIKDYGVEIITGDSTIIIKNVSFCGKDFNCSQIIKSHYETLGLTDEKIYLLLLSEIEILKERIRNLERKK